MELNINLFFTFIVSFTIILINDIILLMTMKIRIISSNIVDIVEEIHYTGIYLDNYDEFRKGVSEYYA